MRLHAAALASLVVVGCAQVLGLGEYGEPGAAAGGRGGADAGGGAGAAAGMAGSGGGAAVTTATLNWLESYGGAGDKFVAGHDVAASGLVSLCGSFDGDIEIDVTYATTGGADVWVARLDGSGTPLWSAVIGGSGQQFCSGAIFAGAETIVAGEFTNDLEFDQLYTGTNAFTPFVARLDAGGSPAAAVTRYGNVSGSDFVRGLTRMPVGIALAGDFLGDIDGGGYSASNPAAVQAAFVSHIFDAQPSMWLLDVGVGSNMDMESQTLFALDADALGRIIAVGETQGSLHLPSLQDPPLGSGSDALIIDIAPDGTPKWAVTGYGMQAATANAVRLDPRDGSAIVVGSYSGNATFAGIPATAVDGTEAFVLKIDSLGAAVWLETYPSPGDQTANGVAVDAAGNIYVGGTTAGPIDFGGGPLQVTSAAAGFVLALTPDGSHRHSTLISATTSAAVRFVDVDATGNVVVAGGFTGTSVSCLGDERAGGGIDRDVFVASLTFEDSP